MQARTRPCGVARRVRHPIGRTRREGQDMKRCLGVVLLVLATAPALAAPTGAWEASQSPEWATPMLAEAERFAARHNVTALMVVRHGTVVADWAIRSSRRRLLPSARASSTP